jgi:hypothetical protein
MVRLLLAMLIALAAGWSQDLSNELPHISVDIRTPPIAARTEGGFLIAYELYITNWYDKSGVLSDVPAAIDHRVRFRVEGEAHDTEIRYLNTPQRRNTLRIHASLRGDSWVVTNGPGGNNHHTSSVLQYEGRLKTPQRFAIDFVRVFRDEKMFHGAAADLHSYRGYGAEVLAVAENPGQATDNAVPLALDTFGGNRVILDLGGGVFAAYAHLQPGSIRVKAGERVKNW